MGSRHAWMLVAHTSRVDLVCFTASSLAITRALQSMSMLLFNCCVHLPSSASAVLL
jgi:hypothetical protein